MVPPSDFPYHANHDGRSREADDTNHGDHPRSSEANDRYGEHWGRCMELSKKQDRQMCEMLKGELDNLLIFAALFSAIVAAFTIESYKWLSANSGNPSPVSSMVAQQVNILWFFSLSASLGVASIGILCMQWVRQYQNGTVTPTKHGVALRRQRVDGFQKWRVPDIVSMLPVTLHLSLVIFGVGLIRLLWEINRPVAATFMAGSILSTAFVLGTLLAPALQFLWIVWHPSSWVSLKRFNSQCPYQSPQAWIGYLIIWPLTFKACDFTNWAGFDITWMNLVNEANFPGSTKSNKAGGKGKGEGDGQSGEKGESKDKDKNESVHDYTDQMVEAEFIWMDKEFRHDINGIKARAEAFEQLSVEAAKAIVKNLGVSVPEESFPSAELGPLYMKVWYLWAYAQDRPGLDEAYMKARVQYMSALDQKKVTLPGGPLGRHLDVQPLLQDKFLIPRFLRCLQTMAGNHITTKVSREMWSIIGDLVEYSFRHSHMEYIHGLGNLFDALHSDLRTDWSSTPPTSDRIHGKINNILEGLSFLWKLHPDVPAPRLNKENANHMEKFVNLIGYLNSYVSSHTRSEFSPTTSHPAPRFSQDSKPGDKIYIDLKAAHTVPEDEQIMLHGSQKRNWDALIALLKKWVETLEKEHRDSIFHAEQVSGPIVNGVDKSRGGPSESGSGYPFPTSTPSTAVGGN